MPWARSPSGKLFHYDQKRGRPAPSPETLALLGRVMDAAVEHVRKEDEQRAAALAEGKTFLIARDLSAPDRLGIRCLICNRTSYHSDDVANRYCAACHRWHDDPYDPLPVGKEEQ